MVLSRASGAGPGEGKDMQDPREGSSKQLRKEKVGRWRGILGAPRSRREAVTQVGVRGTVKPRPSEVKEDHQGV